jgi:putative transposase
MVSSYIKGDQERRSDYRYGPGFNGVSRPGDGNRPPLTRQARPSHLSVRTDVKAHIESPWQNGVAERWIRGCRRDLLDHIIAVNERHLRRLLSEYVRYYHEDRTPLSLGKGTPGRRSHSVAPGRVHSHERLGGLHHRYDRAAEPKCLARKPHGLYLFIIYICVCWTRPQVGGRKNRCVGEPSWSNLRFIFSCKRRGITLFLAQTRFWRGTGSTAYSFDTLNRLTSLAPPSAFGSGSFGFSYDAMSCRTQMTRPNIVTTNYTYDKL